MKRCRNPDCQKTFEPKYSTLQICCSPLCAIAWQATEKGKVHVKKAKKKEHRERKESIKPRNQHLKESQQAFNAFIRERDKFKPCVTCGTFTPKVRDRFGGVWDSGHYKTTGGFPELRFDEANAHKQCKSCNNPGPNKAHQVQMWYAKAMVQIVGQPKKDELDGPHEPKKWAIDELKDIKKLYRKKTRELKKERATA
jgi:hypothetical protein